MDVNYWCFPLMSVVGDLRVGMSNTKEPRITRGVKVQGRAVQAWMGQHGMMAEGPPATHPQTIPSGDTQLAKPGARGKRVEDKHPLWMQASEMWSHGARK